MSRKNIYKPHSPLLAIMLMCFLIVGLAVFILGFYLSLMQKVTPTIPAIILSVIGIVATINGINSIISKIKLKICFENDGVFIVNDGKGKSQFIPWEKFSYAYFCNNNRNQLYLILADKEISEREQKRLVSSSFQKELSNGIFSMRMFELSTEDQVHIEETINEKIPNVRGFATLLSFDKNGKLRY